MRQGAPGGPSTDGLRQAIDRIRDQSGVVSLCQDRRLNSLLTTVVGELQRYASNQYSHIEKLVEIGLALSSDMEVDRLLEMIVDEARALTLADAGTLYVVDATGQNLDFLIFQNDSMNSRRAGCADGPMHLAPIPLRLPDGQPNSRHISAFVANTGKVVNVEDVAETPGFDFSGAREYDRLTGYESRSMLVIPLHANRGEVIGVLQLLNAKDPSTGEIIPFSGEYTDLVTSLASQAAIAIQNAKLYTRLEENEERYQALYENVVEGIFRLAPDGRLLSVNSALARMFGYPSPDAAVKAVTNFPEQCMQEAQDRRELGRAMHCKERALVMEARMRTCDGRAFWGSLSARAVRGMAGDIDCYEGSLVDVSERVERAQTERRLQKAEEAYRAKSDFLARMSHEIRNPMNAILGVADLLRETALTPDQQRYVNLLDTAGESLVHLLNEILDLSRIEAGKLVLDRKLFLLRDVVGHTVQIMDIAAKKKGLEMTLEVAPSVPDLLVGDKARLRQILVNLLGNAIKFTEAGAVALTVGPIQSQEGAAVLEFAVRDTGPGIPPEIWEKLFTPYVQACRPEDPAKAHGTGLGLAICRRLVELMGGDIRVESEPGQGSTFRFSARFELSSTKP